MQREASSGRWRWNILFILVAAAIIIADQLTKNWVRNYTGDQPIFEAGFFRIISVQNTGSSFSMFQGQNIPLLVVAIIGIILIITFAGLLTWKYAAFDTWYTKMYLGLILGGTTGNLVDRIVHGGVTDFLDLGPWPTFNIADSAMVVGVILLSAFILFSRRVRDAFSG